MDVSLPAGARGGNVGADTGLERGTQDTNEACFEPDRRGVRPAQSPRSRHEDSPRPGTRSEHLDDSLLLCGTGFFPQSHLMARGFRFGLIRAVYGSAVVPLNRIRCSTGDGKELSSHVATPCPRSKPSIHA